MTALPGESPAVRAVLAWVDWYTRDLPLPIAQQRRDELASDVWEQLQDPAERRSLLGRAVRGAAMDLAWRRRVLRQAPDRPPLHLRWERTGLLAVVTAEAALLLAALAAALLKALVGGNAGTLGPTAPGVIAGDALGVVVVVAALALAVRRRARWIAPLLLLGALVVLLRVALPAVVQVSTTVSAVYYSAPFLVSHPSWSDLGLVVLGFGAVFHVAVAIAWAPAPRRRSV